MKQLRFTEEVKSAWIAALKSGKYKKGQGHLKRHDCYCCLGVLAEVCGLDAEAVQKDNDCAYLARKSDIQNKSSYRTQITGLTYSIQKTLALLNDRSDSFSPVIGLIKKLNPLRT